MWIMARYLPIAPLSLKSAHSTSSGGKTLLAPTPYALKMALLDVAIRCYGVSEGERLFPFLRDLLIAVDLPLDLVVMKGFSKIRRPLEIKDKKVKEEKEREAQEKKHWPMQPTIAYREYVTYRDPLTLAFTSTDEERLSAVLPVLLPMVNYVGKRGGFIQWLETAQVRDVPDFVELTATAQTAFHMKGILQILDDCGANLTFAQVNIYSNARVGLNKDRLLRHVVLPYRLRRSSRSYSWYQRIGKQEAGLL